MKVVCYTASWCSPCKQMHRILDELCVAHKWHITFKDIEDCDDEVEQYKIMNVPFLVAIDDNKHIIWKYDGVPSDKVHLEMELRELFKTAS